MSFGTNTSGYREQEMRRQSPVLIGVSLSQKTDDFETYCFLLNHASMGWNVQNGRELSRRSIASHSLLSEGGCILTADEE